MAWQIGVENIAGIRSGTADIHAGSNVVRGSNWQGKSSFLKAIEVVLGARKSLTEGETDGRVVLKTPEETYTVRLERRDGTVVREGTPYLDAEYDQISAELYAFLGEDNVIRRAVRRGENLESELTKPVDFENIEQRIADKKSERSRVETELDRARTAARRLPQLQEDVSRLEEELTDLRAECDGRTPSGDTTVNDEQDEMSRLRAERSQVDEKIQRLSDTVERIEQKLDELRTEYDELTVPDTDVTDELDTAREKRESIQTDVTLLQSVYSANKRVLEEDRLDLLVDVNRGIVSDEFDCWLCGSETTKDALRERLSALSERISELEEEATEHEDTVARLTDRQDEIREAKRRRDDLERRIDDLELTAENRRESLESAARRREALTERIDELEDVVAEQNDGLAEIRGEIKRTESELEDKRQELERTATKADRRTTLEAEREQIEAEIESLRNRKQTIKRRTREAFDDAIGDVLDRFDTSFETARLTSTFDMVVARNGREASIDALSEGELELLGIVAALAGHEAFGVADRVPIMLLDQLGSLSEENLLTLINYLDDRSEFLVFTAYPEHESFRGSVIDPSDWEIVSSDPKMTS